MEDLAERFVHRVPLLPMRARGCEQLGYLPRGEVVMLFGVAVVRPQRRVGRQPPKRGVPIPVVEPEQGLFGDVFALYEEAKRQLCCKPVDVVLEAPGVLSD